eukprot:TRINITY_DN44232_c0_g1_i1.p1 TRINITY_DN44232_c0_g1~~TRINITY_DN44232_c0_g1_i1.p1  ORF type:complete len:283 (+),score=72.57 TRINITY_DN44232_c0_g1_i1:46-894(+)
MDSKPVKPRLNKKQKAEKYGKKFKKDYLEFNKQWLGGSLEQMKAHVEASEAMREKADLEREDKVDRKGRARVEDNLAKMIEKEKGVVVRSLQIPKYTLDPAEKLRREIAFKVKSDSLKGYLTFTTTCGHLNIELFCSQAPTACENFLTLSESGYYTNLCFHRLIPGFMIQGGDPTKSGAGGRSCWGPPFQDEFTTLSHSSRGILSMANSGPNTNGSQFFITFAECIHLDGKHTVFGRVVGGMATLDAMEQTPTASSERPEKEIKVTGVQVYWNPFKFCRAEI